jgi:flagellar basal-body rod modification protein FlgD
MTSITGNTYLDQFTTKESITGTKAKGSGSLDQASFLRLMTTQLKTQDPTAPTDNTAMIAQMAQFSQVAGIGEMNASLKAITSDLQASRMGGAASWIGRSALVPSKTTVPLDDGSYAGQITLPEAVSSATMRLVDANGTIVHSADLGARAAGDVGFAWDGKRADGTVAKGALKIEVAAKNAGGAVSATTASWTAVNGVRSPAGGSASKLVTSLGVIAPGDALSLS